jgi:hypothetical protein
VLFLGASFSGEDIARDMSPHIEKGYLVARQAGIQNPRKKVIGAN